MHSWIHEQSLEDVLQRKTEKIQIRRAATFIGVMMLLLTVSMQFTFPVVATILALLGCLPDHFNSLPYLGIGNTAYLCIYAGVYVAVMGIPLLAVLGGRRLFSQKFSKKPLSFGTTLSMVVAAVGGCMLANIITNYLLQFLNDWGVPIPEQPQMMEPTLLSFALCLFVIAVLPAVLEEILFRGCVLRVLRPFGDGFAVLVSAVLFGLMHGNIRQIPFATIVGLVLGWMYVTTNSLLLPMVVHFINNAISVTMEYVSFGLSDSVSPLFYAFVIYGLVIVGVLFAVILFIFCGSQLRKDKRITALRFGGKITALLCSPVFVISLCVFIGLTGLELMG